MSDLSAPSAAASGQFRRLFPYLERERWSVLAVVGLAALGATLAAFEPLALKKLFDVFIAGGVLARASVPFVALIGILIGRESIAALQERLFWRTRLAVNFRLLQAAVERLHSLPLAYHRDQSVGATMTKLERGIAGAMSAFSELMLQLFPSFIYLGVSLVVMFGIDQRLSVVVLLFAPLPALIGAIAAKEQSAREQALLERWVSIFSRFNEVLSGIIVVKSFVMEDREKQRFLGGVQEANDLVLRGVAKDANCSALKNGVIAIARLSALGVGGALVMKHQISLGTLLAFVSYLGGLFGPVSTLTGMYQTLRRAGVALSAVGSILDAPDALSDAPHAKDPGKLSGQVEFRGVSFAYRPGYPVLRDINLRVRPGEMVALVGASGAGKTTLMSLLQRLYDPTAGSILLDGHDLRELEQRSVRRQIGVVLQEGSLFSDSVRDNIAFGRPAATQAEIEAAARAAYAHDFITALPQGYATEVGERAAKLSGGERQRIAIARALLKDAPILILDEATSALDVESEEQVQAALEHLTEGRTTFVIAHRLATVLAADRIVVFKDGAIHETGSHDELLRQDGYYADLVRRQLRGFGISLPAPASAPAPASVLVH